MKQKREDAMQAEYDAMVAALDMTMDQKASLDEINQKHEEAVKARVRGEIKNGGDSVEIEKILKIELKILTLLETLSLSFYLAINS